MMTGLQHAARISPEIARVVNNHRDWQNPQPVRGTGPRPQESLPQPQGYHGPIAKYTRSSAGEEVTRSGR